MNLQRAARPKCAAEDGFTLPEVLAALIIMSLAVVAIVSALGNSIVLSDFHRKTVTADSFVRSYADRLGQAPYVACTSWTATPPPQYQLVNPTNLKAPANFGNPQLTIEFWNGDPPATFRGGCNGTDAGIQKITILVSSTDGRAHEQLTILKRSLS